MKPSFCAGCTKPHADLMLRGHHWLCPSCDPESDATVRARLGPERGYEVPDARAPLGPTKVAFSRAANRVAGPAKFSPMTGGTTATASRPGFIAIRIPKVGADGSPLDAAEARETLRDQPWFAEVQHRGSTKHYHLFDRPDTELAREVRSAPSVDPMEQLREAVDRANKGRP